jgi:hypothetical protein
VVTVLRPSRQPAPRVALSERAGRRLWIVAVLDMMTVAWMIAAGNWLDTTSSVTAVVTLGGHHRLVLLLAILGFVMLTGLGLLTDSFTSAGKFELALMTMACMVSVVAVAGALTALLVVVAAAFGLGFAGRLLFRH